MKVQILSAEKRDEFLGWKNTICLMSCKTSKSSSPNPTAKCLCKDACDWLSLFLQVQAEVPPGAER